MPHGRIVDSPEAVAALPPVTETHKHFNDDVVEVNRGLAVAYHAHDREVGTAAPRDVEDALDVRPPPVWDIRWSRVSYKERF